MKRFLRVAMFCGVQACFGLSAFAADPFVFGRTYFMGLTGEEKGCLIDRSGRVYTWTNRTPVVLQEGKSFDATINIFGRVEAASKAVLRRGTNLPGADMPFTEWTAYRRGESPITLKTAGRSNSYLVGFEDLVAAIDAACDGANAQTWESRVGLSDIPARVED